MNDSKSAIQQAAKAVIAEKSQPRQIFGVGQVTGQVTIHQEGGPLPPPETLKNTTMLFLMVRNAL